MSNGFSNRTVRPTNIVSRAARKVLQPFHSMVKDIHSILARNVSKVFNGEIYVEYERSRNQYVIAAPHMQTDPDQYQVGHTAGKFAVLFGLIPLLLGHVGIEVISLLLPLIDIQWATTLASLIVIGFFVPFMFAAALQFMTIGVDYQATNDTNHDSD